MPVYRPRARVKLWVPNVGTAQERVQQELTEDGMSIEARVHRVRIEVNNHNEADECEVLASIDDAGVDPRFLRSCEVTAYMGDAGDADELAPSADNLRFIGIASEVDRVMGGSGMHVRIRALDYTTLFLAHKEFPPSGVPTYSDTIQSAWERVCDHTGFLDFSSGTPQVVSTVQALKNKLRTPVDRVTGKPSVDLTRSLGSAVSARLAALGTLQVPHGADAWAVWQTAVGSLGLISYIRLGECWVTTATDFYTGDDPPVFIWGLNIQELTESRNVHELSGKNVAIFSFNSLTGKTLEAYYPPLSDVTPKSKGGPKKKVAASALGPGITLRAQDYEVMDCPMPISDQKVLDAFAQRVWEERGRQELKGTLKTSEMFVDTLSVDRFDLLDLEAGDRIRVEIDRGALTTIQRIDSQAGRRAALLERGYSEDMANWMVKNLDGISKVDPEFQVRTVATTLETSGDKTGSYEVEIGFINRIDASGSSEEGEGTEAPPIVGHSGRSTQ